MKFKKSIIISFSLVLVIALCFTVLLLNRQAPVSIEENIKLLTENDYTGKQIISEDDDAVLFKDSIKFSELYPNAELYNLKLTTPYNDMYLQGIDDKGKIYYYIANESTNESGGIFSYDYVTDEWQEIIKTDNTSTAAFITVNDNYLLWMEDKKSNWQKTSLHIYDMKSQKDTCFYSHTINPKTGVNYVIQFNYPVLIGNVVYFDDVIDIDENDNYKIKLFSYNISDNKITEIAEDTKCPMDYKGNIVWLEKSNDNVNSLIYSAADNKYIYKNATELGTTFVSGGNMIIANDRLSEVHFHKIIGDESADFVPSEKDKVGISSWGIKVITEDNIEPIIVTKSGGFVSNPTTNGDIVAWTGNSAGTPKAYSKSKDKIIDFLDYVTEEVYSYDFDISENYILMRYVDYESATSDIINHEYILLKIK